MLIKCVCQLHVVWWNADPITPNNPLAPARIIGIEKNANYAVYDLALLLVIFFHRFVQKQMGIWRSVTDDEGIEPETQTAVVAGSVGSVGRSNDALSVADGNNGRPAAITAPATTAAVASRSATQSEETLDEDGSMEVNGSGGSGGGRAADTSNYLQNVAALSTKKYCSSFTKFFKRLLLQVNRVTVDLYVYIFLCDFINFFVLLFGFTAFGVSKDVTT